MRKHCETSTARPLAGLILAAALAVSAVGCGDGGTPAEIGNAPSETLARVSTVLPRRETLTLTTTQPGRVVAFESTPVFSKVAGYVGETPRDIGDRVEQDALLATILAPELLDELRQKEAMKEQAEAELTQAQAAVTAAEATQATAEAKIREAAAMTSRADADLARWKAEHNRMTELATSGSVSRKLLDESLNSLRAAEAGQAEAAARNDSAKAAAREASAHLEKAKADVTASQARIKVSEAEIGRAATLVSFTQIKSPFKGCVTRRNVDSGHYVHPATSSGAKPLFIVSRTDRVRVLVDVPENLAPFVDRGDKAKVSAQYPSGEPRDGSVSRTSWALDESNRSLRVEIDFENDKDEFRPGVYASVEILLVERTDALTAPSSSIARSNGSAHVFCVRQGKAIRTPVVVGITAGARTEILDGLAPTDQVILSGIGSLKDEQPVEATNAP